MSDTTLFQRVTGSNKNQKGNPSRNREHPEVIAHLTELLQRKLDCFWIKEVKVHILITATYLDPAIFPRIHEAVRRLVQKLYTEAPSEHDWLVENAGILGKYIKR